MKLMQKNLEQVRSRVLICLIFNAQLRNFSIALLRHFQIYHLHQAFTNLFLQLKTAARKSGVTVEKA
jgi:hypothetical protein